MSYGKKSNSFVCVLGGITAYNMINGMFFCRINEILQLFESLNSFMISMSFKVFIQLDISYRMN